MLEKEDNNNKKIQIGLFELTDCEGCQLEILDKDFGLQEMLKEVSFCNFRIISDDNKIKNIDISLIEGAPLTKKDLELVYTIRENSKIVIALGTCAATGGITAGLNEKEREKFAKSIYGKHYKLEVKEALPLSAYIKVDFVIPGCPIDPKLFQKSLKKIISVGWILPEDYPVCQECKYLGNDCLLKKGEPCLGPIIAGGCGAICPSNRTGCLGCQNLVKGASIKQFQQKMQKLKINKFRINQILGTYLKNNFINKELDGKR